MMKLFLALGAAAVALTAAPVEAKHYTHKVTCAKYRHGHCVAWHRMTRAQLHRYRMGYVFGPRYAYTSYNALPRTYVRRYDLSPNYRYVYSGNTIYVVDPATYAVTRIINGIVR